MGCIRERLRLQTMQGAGMPWPTVGPRDASAALCNKGFACICLHINMQDLESLKKRLSVQLGWGV